MTAMIRMRKRSNSFLLGFVLFLIASVLFCGIGYYMLSGNLKMIRNGVRSSATVVEMTKHTSQSSKKKSVTYRPVVEYVTDSGEIIRTEYSSGSSNRSAYRIGQQIGIYYSKDDPYNFLIDKFFDKYGFPAIFLLAGVVSFVMLIVITVRKIKYGAA